MYGGAFSAWPDDDAARSIKPAMTAMSEASTKRVNPVGMVFGFAPWIVYWILVGNVPFRLAVLVAFALSVVRGAVIWLRGERPRTIEAGGLAVFAVLTALAFMTSDSFLERWMQPLSNGGLFVVVLVGLLLGRPFTYDYAKDFVDEQTAQTSGFRWFTKVTTIAWVVALGLMTASSMVPPIVQGDATILDGGRPLSILCYWVIPYGLLGLGMTFSILFPSWFQKQSALMDAAAVDTRTSQPQPRPSHVEDAATAGPTLVVDPDDALADSDLRVLLEGLEPGTTVTVRTRARDEFGQAWRAEALFSADDRGAVDTASDDPVSGDWAAADRGAPIWAMRSEGGAGLFIPPVSPLVVEVAATVGRSTLRRHALRRVAADGVRLVPVDEAGVVGMLALPAEASVGTGLPGVVCFGGSEGGFDSQMSNIALLASHGHVALAAAYFGVAGPPIIAEVPLESFARAVHWLHEHEAVDSRQVKGMGISRGAEGLLAAASYLPDLDVAGLVLVSPSHVTWQAIGESGEIPQTSSWSMGGRPLPFVPFEGAALMPQLVRNARRFARNQRDRVPTLMHLVQGYAASLRDQAAVAGGRIPVAKVRAPVLSLAGTEDAMWPSVMMAEQIATARDVDGDEIRTYEGCGHVIRLGTFPTDDAWSSGIAFGGTREGLAAAQVDATASVLTFLDRGDTPAAAEYL